MAEQWTRKYSPKNSSEVIGHSSAVAELARLIKNHVRGKAILLHGGTGNGKTSGVHAIANELDLELVEINASDARKAGEIKEVIGEASKQMSLFMKSKVILIDEIDGLSGTSDRGGLPEIMRIIEKSSFPIVLTILDPYDRKYNALRKKCSMIEFPPLSHSHLLEALELIAKEEKINYEEIALKSLARQSNGDLRAAVNDLQAMSADKIFSKEDLEALGDRDRTETMLNALLKVFKTTDANVAKNAFDNVNEGIDKVFLWVEENIAKEYTKAEDRARAYEALAEADKFFGRIRRWQYYRFYVYCYNLLSAGVAIAKDEKYSSVVQYKETQRLLKIWIANQKLAKKKAIAGRIAEKTHSSTKRALQDSFPYLQAVIKTEKGKQWAQAIEVTKDELAWMSK